MPRIYSIILFRILKIFGHEICYKKQILKENEDYFVTLDNNLLLKPKLKLKKSDKIQLWYNNTLNTHDAWYVD